MSLIFIFEFKTKHKWHFGKYIFEKCSKGKVYDFSGFWYQVSTRKSLLRDFLLKVQNPCFPSDPLNKDTGSSARGGIFFL